jgi:hypothetical protein
MKGLLIAAGVAALSYYTGNQIFNNRFAGKVKILFKRQEFYKSCAPKGVETLP